MTSIELEDEVRLRRDAESRLKSGTPPAVPDSWTVGPDALARLYRLASSEDSAADALKLLQELQVHQVELGLQHEQMAAAEGEMTETLAHYQNLYEWAPVGYIVAARDGAVLDVNRAGVSLLGADRDAVAGRTVDWFLSAESRTAMRDMVNLLREDGDAASCEVRFAQSGLTARIDAAVPPGGEAVLMIVSQSQDSGEA